MTVPSRMVFVLAAGATATALSLSTLAGWQRGGSLPDRVVWIAIGIALVASAHLLPALIRDAPPVVRGTGSLLWIACLATACYGHAIFFILAQQHAGEQRASMGVTASVSLPSRSLTVVMSERATVTHQLAVAWAQRCTHDCLALDAHRTTLMAKLDALNAERDDIQRRQSLDDRVTAQRDALRADPVTSRLAALLGTTAARVDLLSGLAFAAVLEGIACLLWTVALRSSALHAPVTAATPPEVAPKAGPVVNASRPVHVTATTVAAMTLGQASQIVGREAATDSHEATSPVEGVTDEVAQLARDIAAGRVRATVVDIRRHLGCSQARAVALRRLLVKSTQ